MPKISVDELSDIEEIGQLKSRYFRYVDEKKWDAWRELFTPEARVHIDGSVRTRDEFVSVAREWLAGATSVHRGYMPEIEITDTDTATGIWPMEDYVVFPSGDGPPKGMRGYGHYREEYRRIDGHWRIHTLTLTRLRVEPLEGGIPEV